MYLPLSFKSCLPLLFTSCLLHSFSSCLPLSFASHTFLFPLHPAFFLSFTSCLPLSFTSCLLSALCKFLPLSHIDTTYNILHLRYILPPLPHPYILVYAVYTLLSTSFSPTFHHYPVPSPAMVLFMYLYICSLPQSCPLPQCSLSLALSLSPTLYPTSQFPPLTPPLSLRSPSPPPTRPSPAIFYVEWKKQFDNILTMGPAAAAAYNRSQPEREGTKRQKFNKKNSDVLLLKRRTKKILGLVFVLENNNN